MEVAVRVLNNVYGRRRWRRKSEKAVGQDASAADGARNEFWLEVAFSAGDELDSNEYGFGARQRGLRGIAAGR